jgi:hypothetical protein
VTVFWFGPQNQASFSLSVASQNQQREDDAGHASRLGGLLRLEASHARIFQSGHKTGGCGSGGAHSIITKVVSS